MALATVLEVYLRTGEPSEVIDKLKENEVSLEAFFNQVQIRKSQHDSKIFFKELYRASDDFGFDDNGNVQINLIGSRLKIVYTYFNAEGMEQTDFILM